MPPKKKFTRKQIIEQALEIAKTEGIKGITARKVADKLGSSVAPIYGNFEDIGELRKKVIENIFESSPGKSFLDIGIANLRFAEENSVLFRDLLLNNNEYLKELEREAEKDIIKGMTDDPQLQNFNKKELRTISLKMRIFQLGLSVMIAVDLLPVNLEKEKYIKLLGNMGNDIIIAARLREQKNQKSGN
ncbi:MAG: TetR/AcrR family transcriptional regulator [Bacillota bacterium]